MTLSLAKLMRTIPIKEIAELICVFPRAGRVNWIGASSARREPVQVLQAAEVRAGTGLAADYHARSGRSKRQVTLIQQEHLATVSSLTGIDVTPEMVRRNLVVEGINLLALKDQKFRIGDVLLEGTGLCAPCSRMEEVLGEGGYNAMRGHGGITARVLASGTIRVGDPVNFEPAVTEIDETATQEA